LTTKSCFLNDSQLTVIYTQRKQRPHMRHRPNQCRDLASMASRYDLDPTSKIGHRCSSYTEIVHLPIVLNAVCPRAQSWVLWRNLLYTDDVTLVFERCNITHHLFADDKETYYRRTSHCMMPMMCAIVCMTAHISKGCTSCRLQLNENKTELVQFVKRSRLTCVRSLR